MLPSEQCTSGALSQVRNAQTTSRGRGPAEITKILERGFGVFEGEVLANYGSLGRHKFVVEKYHNGGWLAEPLRTFDGVWGSTAKQTFPSLVHYIDTHLSDCRLASFSELAPGAIIEPHDGRDFGLAVNILSRQPDWPFERFEKYWSGNSYEVVRYHLCIFSPTADFALLGLRCGAREVTWERGKCSFFDDTETHEAWNRTASSRLVLFFDFLKSELAAQ